MLDTACGTAVQISVTDYALREASVGHHRWAAAAAATYSGFRENMSAAQLPQHVKNQVGARDAAAGAAAAELRA